VGQLFLSHLPEKEDSETFFAWHRGGRRECLLRCRPGRYKGGEKEIIFFLASGKKRGASDPLPVTAKAAPSRTGEKEKAMARDLKSKEKDMPLSLKPSNLKKLEEGEKKRGSSFSAIGGRVKREKAVCCSTLERHGREKEKRGKKRRGGQGNWADGSKEGGGRRARKRKKRDVVRSRSRRSIVEKPAIRISRKREGEGGVSNA